MCTKKDYNCAWLMPICFGSMVHLDHRARNGLADPLSRYAFLGEYFGPRCARKVIFYIYLKSAAESPDYKTPVTPSDAQLVPFAVASVCCGLCMIVMIYQN